MRNLYEILVPTQMDRVVRTGVVKSACPISVKYHRLWDAKVHAIAGGLTILQPGKGYWVSPDQTLFHERMIPVRIYCTPDQIEQIADITAHHYNQRAVMFYLISSTVTIKHYEERSDVAPNISVADADTKPATDPES